MTIKQLCDKYDVSQADLTRRFGVPYRTVQGWHIGERNPPDYVVQMMDELLEYDNQKSNTK